MKAAYLSVLILICCAISSLSGQPAPVTVTHGPMLGRLGPAEVAVWVRTSRPTAFRVRYGLDPTRLDLLSAPGTTAIDRDNTGWVLVQGLTPNTKYDYLGWANPIPAGAIHFGQAQLKAGSDILTDPQADFSTLAPGFQEPGRLHVHWGGVAAGVPERELAGLPGVEGDPNANVYQVLERLDAHRLWVRPAAKADGVSSYSIGRRSYYDQRVGNAHVFFLDTRSHRGVSDPTHADRPDLSMLGAPQKAWLLDAKTTRWVAFPHPQVVVQFFNGLTGDLLYAESILVK